MANPSRCATLRTTTTLLRVIRPAREASGPIGAITSLVGMPCSRSAATTARAIVDFPAPGRPQNSTTVPTRYRRDQIARRIAVRTLSGGCVASMSTAPKSEPSNRSERTSPMRRSR